jgi:transketolase
MPVDTSLIAATIRGLAMDTVQKANSGHPGMPMGMAELATVLWTEFLTVDPDMPEWADRDRFVLSNGHGSALLYALLHLSGFAMTMEDLQNFRQWGYHTAGHPEREPHLGIEMTTGPLGQGFGTGVGMALAEAHLRSRLGSDLVDHWTYGFVSDGDLMEGVSAEAASLAGHFALGRLIYVYDDNDISIDGSTDITFGEDVRKRFEAVGWHVGEIDGHDPDAIRQALGEARSVEDRPSLIVARTRIAEGAPNAVGTSKSHGSPLGAEEIRLAKAGIGLDPDRDFEVPDGVYEMMSEAMDRGRKASRAWAERLAVASPQLVADYEALWSPAPVTIDGPGFEPGAKLATRAASGQLFAEMAEKVPGFIGGAADLVESTKTAIDHKRLFSAADPGARDIPFGIREHAMATIVNGIAVHGGLRPYGATFFQFSDYMRPAVRLGALMGAPSIWVWTHDSIFLGEDGPTHQPIEHLSSLRAMPNLWVIRPADATETVEAWELALNRTDGPVSLVLTRQNLPVLDRPRGGVAKGGYVLRDGDDVVLIATGSEVALALETSDLLAAEGVSARVVSLPCWELFFAQDEAYRTEVLGESIPRVSIEAGATFGWERVVGDGAMIGIDRFGASAPAEVLAEQFGFTPSAVAGEVKRLLGA